MSHTMLINNRLLDANTKVAGVPGEHLGQSTLEL